MPILLRIQRYLARRSVLHWNPGNVSPIIVFLMSKVGSGAIVDALRTSREAVFHVHRMCAHHLAAMRRGRLERGWQLNPIPANDLLGLKLFERVIGSGSRARYVTAVREPIGRNLSAYFQHLDNIWRVPDAHRAIPLDQLCRGFLDRYTHDEPLTWFDDEMLPVLGVDVYQQQFPASGWLTIRGDRHDILILRSELRDGEKGAALSAFLGTGVPAPSRVHTTGAKAQGAVYRRFTAALRLPASYVDRMLDSRYCRHFYSDPERAELRRQYLT